MFGSRDKEILREVRESREDLRTDRDAFRQFTAEATLQLRRLGEEHRDSMQQLRAEMRAGLAEMRADHEEMLAEQRAGRQALLAILDRLPPPGEATA